MWISNAAWLKEREDAIQLRLERDGALKRLDQQDVTLGWFMHRLTQVEAERAKLIFNFTGVKVDAPTYEKETSQAESNRINQNPLNSLPNFSDVGDLEAARLGIDWNPEGELTYGVTK